VRKIVFHHLRLEGSNAVGTLMSLYFFTICELDRRVKEDLHGVSLPNAADALSYAEHTIDELRHEVGYDNPRLIMIVQDDDQLTIWSLPFLPAYA